MKKMFKIKTLLASVAILTIASCSSDDASPQTPSITLQDLQVTIDENPTNGAVIGTVQSNSTTALTFSIVSQTPSGSMEIDASTGELTIIDATLFDFETNPTITATVSASGAQNQALITINLNNIAEVNVQNFNSTIDENPTNAQSLGTVNASGDSSLTYSITTQTPSGAMSINTTTGELTVLNASLFDYETNPTISATVQVDNSGTTENLIVTIDLQDKHEVGEYKFGGVIFWVNAAGDEGLVCSINDLNNGNVIQWGNNGIEYQETGAIATAIGTGQANTTAIINVQGTGNYAASLCDNLLLNGYSDWYLPSKDELFEIFINHPIINSVATANGGDTFSAIYWTSSQATTNTNIVWIQFLQSGTQGINNKLNLASVRAIRHWTDF